MSMGELAEMHLNGTVCECCGVWFDDTLKGAEPPMHPRYCKNCKKDGCKITKDQKAAMKEFFKIKQHAENIMTAENDGVLFAYEDEETGLTNIHVNLKSIYKIAKINGYELDEELRIIQTRQRGFVLFDILTLGDDFEQIQRMGLEKYMKKLLSANRSNKKQIN